MADCTTCVPCPAIEGIRKWEAQPSLKDPGYEDHLPDRDAVRPCSCRECCCGKPPIAEFCYEQPKVPESWRPKRCWVKPTVPVANTTTYSSSYLAPEDCLIKTPVATFVPALGLDKGPMTENTMHRLTFLPNPICRAKSIRPCYLPLIDSTPMDCLTNYRKEYIPKPIHIPESYRPGVDNLTIFDKPFETRTTSRLNYLDPGRVVTPSWAPTKCWQKPDVKMNFDTTNKSSFLPICIFPRETPPWAKRPTYVAPSKKVETTTINKLSYLPPGKDCSSIKEPCVCGPCASCACKSPAVCIKTNPCVCAGTTEKKETYCRRPVSIQVHN